MNLNQLLPLDPTLAAVGLAGLSLLFSLIAMIWARRRLRQQPASEDASLIRQVERNRQAIDRALQDIHRCQEGIDSCRREIAEDRSQLAALAKKLEKSLKRVGLVRFNAFPEAGGALSFALALLDDHGSGVVILTLHNRDDCRTFIRQVRHGSSEQRLTAEEKQAIEEALAGNH